MVSRKSIALPAGIVSCPGGSVVVVVVVVVDVVVVEVVVEVEVEVVGSSVDEVGGGVVVVVVVVVVVEVEVVGSSVDEVVAASSWSTTSSWSAGGIPHP